MNGSIRRSRRQSGLKHLKKNGMKKLPPCTIVTFGFGDLTLRMGLPAQLQLHMRGELPPETKIILVSHDTLERGQVWDRAHDAIGLMQRLVIGGKEWIPFRNRLEFYQLNVAEASSALWEKFFETVDRARETTGGNVLFNLSLPSHLFKIVIQALAAYRRRSATRRRKGWVRLMVEKPFGIDLKTARELNREIAKAFDEDEALRIDHYLGKESLRALYSFRFNNPLVELLWNAKAVRFVQIIADEELGVGMRQSFYDSTGGTRDMVESHLLTLAAIVLMEKPKTDNPREIRRLQLEVMRSIKRIDLKHVVRGQYEGYREEIGKETNTETYVALMLVATKGPLKGIPVYIRTGKALKKKATQLRLGFGGNEGNELVFALHPNEGARFHFNYKVPEPEFQLQKVDARFGVTETFARKAPDSYEAIFRAAINGDLSLFVSGAMAERCWHLIDPIVEHFRKLGRKGLNVYPKRSAGPQFPASCNAPPWPVH